MKNCDEILIRYKTLTKELEAWNERADFFYYCCHHRLSRPFINIKRQQRLAWSFDGQMISYTKC